MIRCLSFAWLFLALFTSAAKANESRGLLPKWEAGAGFGYVRFEHYPSSDQYTELALPFPTFQYRGDILRADDREGARLYIARGSNWRVQLGGLGFPPLNASTNSAREGMANLPVLAALGPQLETRLSDDLTFKLGAYQAIAAEWLSAKGSGGMWETDLTYRKSIGRTSGSLSLNFMGASQEVHELYFSVPKGQATLERAAFDAKAGFLQSQLSYFQSYKVGDFAFYVGARVSDLRWSANRESPLHKADRTFSGLAGITYTIYRSKIEGVQQEDASGVVDQIRRLPF